MSGRRIQDPAMELERASGQLGEHGQDDGCRNGCGAMAGGFVRNPCAHRASDGQNSGSPVVSHREKPLLAGRRLGDLNPGRA